MSKNINLPLIESKRFDYTLNKQVIGLFTLQNKSGTTVQITNYGARVVSLWTVDKNGNFEDIVLGYDHIDTYINSNKRYYGATIGRYGNRIRGGKISLEGKQYQLAINNETNHLHGGPNGFHQVVWNVNQIGKQQLALTYYSKDGEENFPGNLKVTLLYVLTDANELKIEYTATTDKTTIVNLTNHSYFNLKGAGNGSIKDHMLKINSNYFLPTDQSKIPTGKLEAISNSPMDFSQPSLIGKRIADDFEQLKIAGGYDHTWVIDKKKDELILAAEVYEVNSGRTLETYTNQPGVQFYSNNSKNEDKKGKYGKVYKYQEAFCLETQHFPDSPNQPNFPSTILKPSEIYKATCIYKFGVKI